MIAEPASTHIVYRCPDCGTAVYGFVGKFALSANMLRLKCSCGKSALDVTITNDQKIRLAIPCLFCKTNHNYVISQKVFFEKDIFILNCPYANMDIAFIGEKENTDRELMRSADELEKLLTQLEAESLADIQPEDINDEDVLPDATVYDTIRFLIKTLECEEKIDCPCHSGNYDLRYAPGGMEVFCPHCEASHLFDTRAVSASEEYLSIDSLFLK